MCFQREDYFEKAEQKEQVYYSETSNECGKLETNARGLRLAERREITKAQTPDILFFRWSDDDIRREQLQDPDISPLIHWKETTTERPVWEKVSTKNCTVKVEPVGETSVSLWTPIQKMGNRKHPAAALGPQNTEVRSP